jgi:hypothetical protein
MRSFVGGNLADLPRELALALVLPSCSSQRFRASQSSLIQFMRVGRCRTPASRLSDSAATEGSARLGLGEKSYPRLTQLTAPKLAVMFPTVMETSNGIITTTSSGGLASVPFGPCVISHQQFHSSQKCRQSVGVGKRVSWWVWGRASHPDRQVDEECSAHGGARRRTEAHAPP